MYAIAGVSGNTGAATADALLAKGEKIRVIVRDAAKGETWAARGAEVAVADLEDSEALAQALKDVDGAFLLLPPKVTENGILDRFETLTRSQISAAEAAGLAHVVLLSSVGAHLASGTGPIRSLNRAEDLWRGFSGARTFLRPCYFMENWANLLHPVTEQGVLPSFLHPLDREVPMISVRDIGRAAAEALIDGGSGTQVIELAGPRAYSPEAIAAVFSEQLNRPVAAVAVPQDQWSGQLQSVGLSADMAGLLAEMYQGINEGRIVPESGSVRQGTTGFETVAAGLFA